MKRAWALVGVLVLAGCAPPAADVGAAERPAVPSGAPVIHDRWATCPDAGFGTGIEQSGAPALPRLDGSVAPVSAIRCGERIERRTDGGQDLVAAEERSDDVAALVVALRLPDDKTPPARGNVACPLSLEIPPFLAMLDAGGRWVRPGFPVDRCGQIRPEVRAALKTMSWTSVATRTVHEVESAAAAAAGCADSWADMVSATATFSDQRPAAANPFGPDVQVRLCVYRVPPEQQGTGKPAGRFESGGLLGAQRWAAVRAAFPEPTSPAACGGPAGRFALLQAADRTGGTVYAELDGCHRLLVEPGGGLGQGTAAFADALVHAR